MSEYVRTVTTNTSPADTLASAQEIAASLEAEGLTVTIGDPYTDHSEHPDPEEQRHRVDLTVSTTAPMPAVVAEEAQPELISEIPTADVPAKTPETETAP